MRIRLLPTIGFVGILLSACAGSEDRGSTAWEAIRNTVGDTIIVRTVSGSVWGNARLVEEVRVGQLDGPDGRFLGQLGRQGEGPGELKAVDSGLAVLPDGRILARDPGNARITVFGAGGEYDTEWRTRGTVYTSTPLHVDRAGKTYVVLIDFTADGAVFSFVRYGPDGQPRDTLPTPRGEPMPMLRAERVSPEGRRSSASREVPFWPQQAWALSRDGQFVTGRPETNSIDVPRAGRVLRIERDFEPVAVLDGERANIQERTIHAMRQIEPGWDWDGPAIPAIKPAFRNMMLDADGRLWVNLYTEARPKRSSRTGSRLGSDSTGPLA